ncbi:MAG: hypothetical protein U0469_00060 [Candidatus Paceibacterota bacterium]|jgi:uncharacterized HAD superfamily protein
MSKKLKIGVDIDEILAPFNNNFIDFLNKKINTNYKVENFSSYNIEEETGHTKEEIHELLDEFSISLNAKEMMPIFGAVESIFDLQKNDCELYAITARPVYIETETREWIEKHFSNHFKEIYHLGRSHKSEIKEINKGDISKELDIKIFIEDSLKNAFEISSHNIPVILLDKPWNQEENLPENIHRVKDWDEILQKIEELKNVI